MSDSGQGFVIREGLIVRPGDSLLLRTDRCLTMAEVDEIATQLRERLPGIDQVCFMEGIAEIAVFRPDETRES